MKGASKERAGSRVEAMVAYVLAHRERLEEIGKGALTFSFAGGSLAVEVKEVEPQITQITQISRRVEGGTGTALNPPVSPWGENLE